MCNWIAENLTKPVKMHFFGRFGRFTCEIPNMLGEDWKTNSKIVESTAAGLRTSFEKHGSMHFAGENTFVVKADDVTSIMLCDENDTLMAVVRNEANG